MPHVSLSARSALAIVALTFLGPNWLCARGHAMSYREATLFLHKHTQVVELKGPAGARVAVCPAWQGRVMTSTCAGPEGLSFGFINAPYIEQGKINRHFNNYGGEDRMWLSPEGGPFSLWFKPGDPQNLDHWFTAPAMNEGGWGVTASGSDFCRMQQRMKLENASATQFDLAVVREVRLLAAAQLAQLFGASAAEVMTAPSVKLVAYETANSIQNQGSPLTKAKGLVSIWMLGMLNAGPDNVVIVPYKPGSDAQLGPVVKSDYFGAVPADRLKILSRAILFRADAQYRSKLGTSQRRACNVLGSIDFRAGVLTLVHFTMPDDPTKHPYMNNMWGLPQPAPYVGDVANTYNDGPSAPGKPGMGNFYEIESVSPAAELKTGDTLVHRHRTVHIQAEPAVLERLARDVLDVDLSQVRREMLGR
jgi:hypothetical protein